MAAAILGGMAIAAALTALQAEAGESLPAGHAGPSAAAAHEAAAPDCVAPKVALRAEPFRLEDVRLLDGPFKHAMDLDREYLLSLDPDRLLHVFRLSAGIPSTARPYGGWMAPNHRSRGEFVGHYLSACAAMYASTGDERLKAKVRRVVAGLAQCQEKSGNGFLHTHPDLFTGECKAPLPFWYQVHKVLAGLLDAHRYCGDAQALEVARRLADWACAGASKFNDAQFQAMLQVEPGGMNEALANLYARTGDSKYLRLALRFNHRAVLGPAMQGIDALDKLHANTQVPKFTGAAREYELTGDASLRAAAESFWGHVVHERSYVIGGNSDGELFSPKATLSKYLSTHTCETCNTYNMLKLTRHLFAWEPKAEYADYYERALYNHILASQHPQTGMMCYYVTLNGPAKVFGEPEGSFWCCYGTGIENHAKYGDSIYFHDAEKGLDVNLFIASDLDWKKVGVRLRQETKYPESDATRLVFTCEKPVSLTLRVRHPSWATSGIEVSVNGRKEATESRPGSYASLSRTWRTGDVVNVRLPMNIHTEAFRDNPRRLAILYGPLVLTAPLAEGEGRPAVVGRPEAIPSGIAPTGVPLHFTGSPPVFRWAAPSHAAPVSLVPFYREYRQPHIVYWDVLTEEQWPEWRAKHQGAFK